MPPAAYPAPPLYHPYNPAYPQPYGSPYPPAYRTQPATNGMAIGSLVSSLVGIPSFFYCLPFVGPIIGIVLGIVALNQISKRHQKGKGMAIAGIAIGSLTLIGILILIVEHSSALFWY
jgi:hypothetical protein